MRTYNAVISEKLTALGINFVTFKIKGRGNCRYYMLRDLKTDAMKWELCLADGLIELTYGIADSLNSDKCQDSRIYPIHLGISRVDWDFIKSTVNQCIELDKGMYQLLKGARA